MRSRAAFSLVEGLMVVTISSLVLVGGVQAYKALSRGAEKTTTQGSIEGELAILHNQILQIGRLAKACYKTVDAVTGNEFLQCEVDFETPPIGNYKLVRFIKLPTESTIRYEMKEGANWVTKITYGSSQSYLVNSFKICGDTELSGPTPACTINLKILPDEITKRYSALKVSQPTVANRFIRFEIRATGAKASLKLREVVIQSAFFVRNPSEYTGAMLQWGTR